MEKVALAGLLIAFAASIWTGIILAAQFAWNEVAHAVFGAPYLTFWQTFGAMFLLGLIAGDFRRRAKGT